MPLDPLRLVELPSMRCDWSMGHLPREALPSSCGASPVVLLENGMEYGALLRA